MSETTNHASGEPALVTVIMPIYNAGPYLDQAIESVRAQTYGDLEILCINDGSTDDSLATMTAHAAADGRVRVIDKPNQGYGASCNRGLDEARGYWIAILEPDDWIEPGMIADLVAFAEGFPEPIDVVKSPYWRIVNPDTPRQQRLNCSYRRRIRPARQPFAIAEAAHLLRHHPSIWSALYRAGYLAEKGIRFREIPGAGWADNPFLIETLCQTDRIAYLDTPHYCYREETMAKARAFAERSTLVPFERWSEMLDIMERLGVDDERVMRAHISRGFTYLSGVIEFVDIDRPDVHEAACAMFARMDPDLVFSDTDVSPGGKRLFAELRGIPCPRIGSAYYVRQLVKEGLYTMRNNGPSYAVAKMTDFLRRKDARVAGR